MKYFSADLIYTNLGPALTDHVIVTTDQGDIQDITHRDNVSADVLHVEGAIIPGFVNAHCHLELSHLRGQLNTGTGLIPFIRSIVTLRDFPQEEIIDAIKRADQEMLDNGIMAVGDISNKLDTAPTKAKSEIAYYSFVEMFDFLQDENAQKDFDGYYEVYKGQSEVGLNKKSCVPHAPYSVSPTLFDLINQHNTSEKTISIHNQETVHENLLFQNKTGELLDFYSGFGISLDHFSAKGTPSIDYAIKHMDSSLKTLFIHNTMCDNRDIQRAHEWNDKCYWVTCPNANLFIENRLPNYQTFIDEQCKMAIGTDSLSSNWQLSILDEMKSIQKFQSYISTETLVKWSSYHAAEALGYDHLGSIEKGQKPGLVGLWGLNEHNTTLQNISELRRLI